MNLSASEKATLYFYEWEYLGRGYYHFDEAVALEPPFKPFHHQSFNDELVDDGKVPSLFKKAMKLLGNAEPKEEEYEPESIEPNLAEVGQKLVGISLSFKNGQEISSVISIEFLNMLAYTNNSISFEIHGTHEGINIQIVCSIVDLGRVESHIKAYFPTILFKELDIYQLGFDFERNVGIGDFGLHDEFMRPIQTAQSFSLDPLTSIIATFDNLEFGDTALFQVVFKGVSAPWSKSIINSVSDSSGGSFFSDSPEMLRCAEAKVSSPLFSVVMRIVTQGESDQRTEYLAKELIRSIASVSSSEYNRLIPLSNEGYDYEKHLRNVYERSSNRLGFFLNSNELALLVHYPNRSIVSNRLNKDTGKTKALPREGTNHTLVIGTNTHNGIENEVSLSTESMLRHCHIIGATGVGKSTLIANMIINHMEQNDGCIILDPHGDIIEDILLRVPEQRKEDVIVIDPSDSEYPLGFNLLHANNEAEKMVLSSDLVSAFKRHSTSWGDNMTAVLSNAINTFLESDNGGTLIELMRFLIEENFRNDFLENVEDSGINYYWEHEYPLVKKGIAPLLTRIDTFLRPKIVRYMLAQKAGIDFKACIEEKKIVLIKLSQGLIGEENSYLLGSLFLSKINQVARSRQSIAKEKRHPYYVYLDEFQNFITPSITSMLSGVRKYGISLTLAHQELAQIEEPKVLNSVISNPQIRICFRLGDNDAKKLESGFSFFEQNDLQSLGIGQAIMRVGSSSNDFNIQTYPPAQTSENGKEIQEYIIENTRSYYAKPKEEIQELLDSLWPKVVRKKKAKKVASEKEEVIAPVIKTEFIQEVKSEEAEIPKPKETQTSIPKEVKEKLIEEKENSIKVRDHNYLQMKIRKMGQNRGFLATIEKETKDGGRIDITLEKDAIRIAFEISVTNTPQYEVKNIRKCLKHGYLPVVMVSKDPMHLAKIERLAKNELRPKDFDFVKFIQPNQIADILNEVDTVAPEPSVEIVKGFRVITEFETDTSGKAQNIKKEILKMIHGKKS